MAEKSGPGYGSKVLHTRDHLTIGLPAADAVPSEWHVSPGLISYTDALSVSGPALSNYNVSYTNGKLDIGKANLTVTGNTVVTSQLSLIGNITVSGVGAVLESLCANIGMSGNLLITAGGVLKTGMVSAGEKIQLIPGPRDTSIAEQNQNLLAKRNQKDLWD